MPGQKLIDRIRLERASVRLSLALGVCITLGLWAYTGYSFNQRIDGVRKEAAVVADRVEVEESYRIVTMALEDRPPSRISLTRARPPLH